MSIWEWKKSYVDLWSLVHFLSGVLLGFALIFFKADFLDSLIIVVSAAIAWEFFELIFGLAENLANQAIDVLVVVLGYFFALWFLPILLGSLVYWYFFAFTVALTIIMNFLGWRDYRKRGGEKISERVERIKSDIKSKKINSSK